MTSLFFFLAVVYFLYEFTVLLKPQGEVDRLNKYSSKEYLQNKDKPKAEALNGCVFVLMHMTYLVWTFIGLAFSSQWISFLILVIVGLISGIASSILKRFNLGNSKIRTVIKFVDAAICSSIIADIYLVHFQKISPGLVTTFLTWF